jgi:hypothetical protein
MITRQQFAQALSEVFPEPNETQLKFGRLMAGLFDEIHELRVAVANVAKFAAAQQQRQRAPMPQAASAPIPEEAAEDAEGFEQAPSEEVVSDEPPIVSAPVPPAMREALEKAEAERKGQAAKRAAARPQPQQPGVKA